MPPPGPTFDGERLLAELGWVRALAARLVQDPGIAEDAAQDAWLLASERPPRTDTTRGLRAWLARVTHTMVRSRVRSERARVRREAVRRRPEASEPATHEVVARTELQQRVVAAVMALAEPYRSAVLLRHVDGLSAREIAARQSTSEENARQRVARGLAQLRRELDREFGGDGRAWALALAGTLRDSGGGATTVAGGTLVMKSITWTGAALAAAALVVAWVARGADGPDAGGGAETQGGAAFAAAGPEEPPREAEREHTGAPATAGRSAPPAAEGAAPARWRVRARVVDARGAPIAGARLALTAEPARGDARSDRNGDVELALTGDLPILRDESEGELVSFVARAEGCADVVRFEPRPAGGERGEQDVTVLELGELRLYPVGAIGGIVRDESGAPLAGAEVRLTLPTLGRGPREHGWLLGPPYALGERRGFADDGGRFVFEEVGEGAWRAWAGAPGLAWSASEPVRVERGAASQEGARELELVLAPLPATSVVRGVARSADGRALAEVIVTAARPGDADATSWASSDELGRFALAVHAGQAYDLHARYETRGNAPEHGPASLAGVRGGDPEVVLVLPRARWIEVTLADEGGAPQHAMLRTTYGFPEQRDWFPTEVPGRARVLVPDQAFHLAVTADGFVPLARGPIEPATAPAELQLLLEPLARVRGVVRSSGRTVAGATVQLVRVAGGGEIAYLYGFPARLDGTELVGTRTDSDGRFELAIGDATDYVLFAEKEGHAAGELGPLALDPARDEELDVELPAPGAVEGRVLVAAGESAAGILVRLCRGDMRVHEAVTDADGRYRVEGLTPGPFMAEAQRRRAGRSPGMSASPIEIVRAERFEFPWQLEVRAGETVRHDIDLAAQELGTVAGFLRVDGAAPEAATVRLVKRGDGWTRRAFDAEEQALERDGSFAFGPHRTEDYWLVLETGAGDLAGTTLVCALALERGANVMELELASASLAGELPAGETGAFAVVVELGPERFAVTPVPARTGRFELAGLLAGDARLVAQRSGATDPREWAEVARFTLAAGARTVLR